MLRVNVGMSRKLSKDFNSTGFSVNLEGEVCGTLSRGSRNSTIWPKNLWPNRSNVMNPTQPLLAETNLSIVLLLNVRLPKKEADKVATVIETGMAKTEMATTGQTNPDSQRPTSKSNSC